MLASTCLVFHSDLPCAESLNVDTKYSREGRRAHYRTRPMSGKYTENRSSRLCKSRNDSTRSSSRDLYAHHANGYFHRINALSLVSSPSKIYTVTAFAVRTERQKAQKRTPKVFQYDRSREQVRHKVPEPGMK